MGLSYGAEKFSAAVYSLATSPKSIQQRIADAFIYSLIHIKPDEDLHEDLRFRFQSLHERVIQEKPVYEGEGTIQATTRNLSDDEAVEIAREIMAMAYEVEQAIENETLLYSQQRIPIFINNHHSPNAVLPVIGET